MLNRFRGATSISMAWLTAVVFAPVAGNRQTLLNVLNRARIIMLVVAACMMIIAPAWAGTAGIATQTADQVGQQLVTVCNSVVEPIGAVVIFLVIVYTSFALVLSAHKPDERAKVMGALPFIAGGGICLGAVMLLSGFFVGLMVQVNGGSTTP